VSRPEAPAPMLRRGPRPLLMHLMLAQTSPDSDANSSNSAAGSNDSRPRHAGGAGRPGGLDPATLAGIAAYRRHPFSRDLPDPAVLWQHGESRLLDFGPEDGIPVLFVPSLVNRGYILDLTRERSMLRWLSGHGIRPMLMEWGWPGAQERRFTMTDYIAGRLEPALARAAMCCERSVALVGYCMGGLLCIASALRRPSQVAALGLIATPWDFHAAGNGQPPTMAGLAARFETMIRLTGALPIDAIQLAFAAVEPAAIARKFRNFGAMPQDDERTRLFVAIEDWLNDGVPLAGPVALEVLRQWYAENTPARGLWRVDGEAIRPEALVKALGEAPGRMPVLLAIPQRDRIVPPESAAPLVAAFPWADVLELPGGHVSVVAGPRAPGLLWEPLLAWLRSTAAAASGRRQALRKRPTRRVASRVGLP